VPPSGVWVIRPGEMDGALRKVRERVQGRHVGDTYSLPETLSPFGRIKKGDFSG